MTYTRLTILTCTLAALGFTPLAQVSDEVISFPRHKGGPMKYVDGVGLDRVLADIREFAKTDPVFW